MVFVNIVNNFFVKGGKSVRKVGVFVCWCGSNIAGTVDVEKVRDAVKDMPGVVHSVDYQYMC